MPFTFLHKTFHSRQGRETCQLISRANYEPYLDVDKVLYFLNVWHLSGFSSFKHNICSINGKDFCFKRLYKIFPKLESVVKLRRKLFGIPRFSKWKDGCTNYRRIYNNHTWRNSKRNQQILGRQGLNITPYSYSYRITIMMYLVLKDLVS